MPRKPVTAAPPAKPSRAEKTATARAKPIILGRARPHVMSEINVWDAALNRMRMIFDDFEGKVVVSNSGGKDSTIVVELAAMVAKEKGCLPLKVQWLDQECEYQATVEYQRYLLNERDDIDFDWYQVPFRIFNATNHDYPWLNCWEPGEEWVREKEPNSIHDNPWTYSDGRMVDRFKDCLSYMNYSRDGWAVLTGMRAEESPARRLSLTTNPGHRWMTYASGPGTFQKSTMVHPIYDWSYRDVWKAIFVNDWRYNAYYDTMYRYGVQPKMMRVSNYTHEVALAGLHMLQETEPETWEAAVRRLQGINTFGHVGRDVPSKLPYMFNSWVEYMEYLIENLAQHEEHRAMYRKHFAQMQRTVGHIPIQELAQVMVGSVIGGDIYGTGVQQYMVSKRAKSELIRKAVEGAK